MEFRILGQLEVGEQGRPITIGRGKQRALLALLIVNRNSFVSRDLIVDSLWGATPPPTAAKNVQIYVSQLRRALGPHAIVTEGGGYRLAADDDALDAARFERLFEEGRRANAASDWKRARELLCDGLALWRGAALADLAYEGFAQDAARRLEEIRLGAVEERIRADLELGHAVGVVAELEALVREHPLREGFRAQLMLALYQAGRQADALRTYKEGRRALHEELGLEPSPVLREIERAILTHDAALAPRRVRALRSPTGWKLAVVATAAVAAVAGAILVLSIGREGSGALDKVAAHAVGVIDPRTNTIAAQVALGADVGPLAVAHGTVWVTNPDTHTVTRIDAERRRLRDVIAVPGRPTGLWLGPHDAWIIGEAAHEGATLWRFDPEFDEIPRTIDLRTGSDGSDAVIAGDRFVWTVDVGVVSQINAKTGKVLEHIPIGPVRAGSEAAADFQPAQAIALTDDSVWVAVLGALKRISRASGSSLQTIEIAGKSEGGAYFTPAAVASSGGDIWVAARYNLACPPCRLGRGVAVRIARDTGSVKATIPVGNTPVGIAIGAGAVWVANADGNSVTRIDPRTDTVTATIPIGNRPVAIASGGGAVWVSTLPAGG